jgi:hypothetical protein
VPALRPVVSSPLPSEQDLPISPHPALHKQLERSGRSCSQPSSVKYSLPVSGSGAPVFTGDLLPSDRAAGSLDPFALQAAFPPSLVGRHSYDYYWSPPRPDGHSGPCPCPNPRRGRRAPPGPFPRSLIRRSAGSPPSCTPGASSRATATPRATSTARPAATRSRRAPNRNRCVRLSALLPHPARRRQTLARSSTAAPVLHRTSGIRLPLSFSRPLRQPGARSLTRPVIWHLVAQSCFHET